MTMHTEILPTYKSMMFNYSNSNLVDCDDKVPERPNKKRSRSKARAGMDYLRITPHCLVYCRSAILWHILVH